MQHNSQKQTTPSYQRRACPRMFESGDGMQSRCKFCEWLNIYIVILSKANNLGFR